MNRITIVAIKVSGKQAGVFRPFLIQATESVKIRTHNRLYMFQMLRHIFLLTLTLCLSFAAQAQISFRDVAAESGIEFTGRGFGASWGDVNGDGWADLWVGNHSLPASLYLNNRGEFTNAMPGIWTDPSMPDGHGAAMADFDNDGDHDIFYTVGGASGLGLGPSLLLINNAGQLTNEATKRGVDQPLGRGRMPLWFDWNNDGLLDLYLSNIPRPDGQAPSSYFQQTGSGQFVLKDMPSTTRTNFFSQISDLKGDGTRMLIIHARDGYPEKVFALDSSPPTDLRSQLNIPSTHSVHDVVIGDFNGDLRPDFYIARLDQSSSESILTDGSTARAYFNVNAEEKGMRFHSAGDLHFELGPFWEANTADVYIGSAGTHPSAIEFELSASDPGVQGIAPHVIGVGVGIYIGYDKKDQIWTVLVNTSGRKNVNIKATSTTSISNLQANNLGSSTLQTKDRLLMQNDNGFFDSINNPGLSMETACDSVAAGDFDNDMDLDIYLVCRSQVHNVPNILLENRGNGIFDVVPGAGGAEGSTLGKGDIVAVADYNNDGFLDLFVANGSGEKPFADDGPNQLFRNLGNDNNWLQLKLQGVQSNRDGIGARVVVTAGGVQQLREQNNAVRRSAQDQQRLHFGLADNTSVSSVTIQWPSGIVQTLTNLPANKILTVVEDTGVLEMPPEI